MHQELTIRMVETRLDQGTCSRRLNGYGAHFVGYAYEPYLNLQSTALMEIEQDLRAPPPPPATRSFLVCPPACIAAATVLDFVCKDKLSVL